MRSSPRMRCRSRRWPSRPRRAPRTGPGSVFWPTVWSSSPPRHSRSFPGECAFPNIWHMTLQFRESRLLLTDEKRIDDFRILEFRRAALEDQAAVIEHEDPLGDLRDQPEVVLDQQHAGGLAE